MFVGTLGLPMKITHMGILEIQKFGYVRGRENHCHKEFDYPPPPLLLRLRRVGFEQQELTANFCITGQDRGRFPLWIP